MPAMMTDGDPFTSSGSVQTTVGDLHVTVAGHDARETIVCWHVLFGDSTVWGAQVEALSSRYRLLLIDGPGHGASGLPPRAYTLDDCAVAMVQVLDAYGVEEAVVMGLGWGGLVALRVALHVPAKVRALVLLNASAEADPLLARLRLRSLAAVIARTGVSPFIARSVAPTFFTTETRLNHRSLIEAFVRHMRGMDGPAAALAMRSVDQETILDQLPRIATPTLVLVGLRDTIYPEPRSTRIAAAIPGARLVKLPHAAHVPTQEVSDAVNTALTAFLSALPDPSPA